MIVQNNDLVKELYNAIMLKTLANFDQFSQSEVIRVLFELS